MSEKVILEVDINVSESIVNIEKLKIAIKEQQAIMKLYGKDTDQFKKAATKVYGMKEEVKILSTATQQQVKMMSSNATSMKGLSLQLGKARERYRNLSEAERNNEKIGGALLSQIQKKDAELKRLDATMGNHQRNVGNYEKALQGLGSQFTTIFSAAGLANLATSAFQNALSGIKSFISGATSAFIKQENAATRLRFALQGNTAAFEQLKKTASEWQKITVFADEDIIGVQAYAAALGMTQFQIDKLVHASIQLATVTGQDLKSTSEQLAKTMTGEVAKGLKVHVDGYESLTEAQIANGAVIDMIGEKYKGFAENQAKSAVGALKQLQNELGDTQEEIGQYTIQLEIWWEKLKGALSKDVVDYVSKIKNAWSVLSGEAAMLAKETIVPLTQKFDAHQSTVATVLEKYAELTGTTKELVTAELEKIKSTELANKKYKQMAIFVAEAKEKAEKQAKIDEDAEKERSANQKKRFEEQKKQLNELENIRIQIMHKGKEQEKALEKKRYEDYIKQWGESEEAYILHKRNLFEIDEAYRKAREAGEKKFLKEQEEWNRKYLSVTEMQATESAKYVEQRRKEVAAQLQKDRDDEQMRAEEQLEAVRVYGEQLGNIVESSMDENGLNLQKFGQQLGVFILDILKKQSQAAVAAAFVGSLATPASIGTGGAAGLVQAGMLTALIEAAFQAAKFVIMQPSEGFYSGGFTGYGGAKEAAGIVHKNEVVWSQKDIQLAGGLAAVEAMRPTSGFGSFAAPTMNNAGLTVADLAKMNIVVTVEDINAGIKKNAIRTKIGKI